MRLISRVAACQMALVVRVLLLAAVAGVSRAGPYGDAAAFDEVATTSGGATLATDAAPTAPAATEDATAATEDALAATEDAAAATEDAAAAASTDDPRTEPPTPPRPVVFLPADGDSSESSSSSSEESSESPEDSKTGGTESTTAQMGAEESGPHEATTPDDIPSENEDDEDLFANIKERYAVPGLKLRKHRCPGVVNGRTVGGVCLDKGECLLKRGAKAGHCGLLGSCCYFQHSCGDVSHYKVSHFANPQNLPPECELRVNVYNRDVCQIRVDFEEFSLAQPERDASPDNAELLGGYRCIRDRFTVEAPSSRNLGFDALCGENRGQHIYIPVNATLGGMAVRLNFRVSNRTDPVNGTLLSPARWLLRITQLECAAAEYDYSSIHSALAAAGYQAVNRHVLAATDADLLAPQGCLQYFPQRTGTYMSFNYAARLPTRKYLADQHYAICIRRRPGDCGIRHTVVGDFLIDFNAYTSTTQTYTDRSCDTRDPSAPYSYASDDYLYVPNGIVNFGAQAFTGSPLASKFCGLSVQTGDTITTTAAGPFNVYFHSDSITFRDHISDEGFQMRFDVLSGSCRLSDPGTSDVIG